MRENKKVLHYLGKKIPKTPQGIKRSRRGAVLQRMNKIYDKEFLNAMDYDYNRRPKENIPDMKLYDYQDYTDWKKLPTFVYI